MLTLYNEFIYQPLFNLLILFYNLIPGHDIGLAIILITILIKVIFFPISLKALKNQKVLQDIQPKLEALKVKYKDEKEKIAPETIKLYKEARVNPLSSCLPLLIQLPFLIAVYQVFRVGLAGTNFDLLYSFVANPHSINTMFLGLIDLSKRSIGLTVLAAASQYWQTKMLSQKKPPLASDGKIITGAEDENLASTMNKQMTIMMPLMTLFIGWSLPAGLILYWLITTLLTVAQQKYFLRQEKVVEKNK